MSALLRTVKVLLILSILLEFMGDLGHYVGFFGSPGLRSGIAICSHLVARWCRAYYSLLLLVIALRDEFLGFVHQIFNLCSPALLRWGRISFLLCIM